MTTAELTQAASKLGGSCYLLVQGYPFTTFGRFLENGSPEFPPVVPEAGGFIAPDPVRVSWDLFWDVRVFGAAGDWHAWRSSGGEWKSRLLKAAECRFERHYLLWGEETKDAGGGWICRTETRGARVWLPSDQAHATKLRVRLRIDYDENGVAGIIDAALVGFA